MSEVKHAKWQKYFNVPDWPDAYDCAVMRPEEMDIDETYEDIARVNEFCNGELFE